MRINNVLSKLKNLLLSVTHVETAGNYSILCQFFSDAGFFAISRHWALQLEKKLSYI